MTTPRRNDLCPCGSGEKYKRCCEGKTAVTRITRSSRMPVIGGAAVVIAAGVLAINLNRRPDAPPAPSLPASQPVTATAPPATGSPAPAVAPLATGPAAPGTRVPQPPGLAPPGQVWSPEHGHWHRAPGAAQNPVVVETSKAQPGTVTTNANRPIVVNRPQPPGPAPEGKVWSPLHGHWHDAPPAGSLPAPLKPGETAKMDVPQPEGPVPPGKVWSREHGHWHDVPTQ